MLDRLHAATVHLFLWLSIVFLAGCLVPPAIILYWALDDTPPLTALSGRFVRWDERTPGVALVEWAGVRHRSCAGTAYRWLIGNRVWELPPEAMPYAGSTATFDGEARWVAAVPVPRRALETEPGPLAYRVTFEWACNPLQKWWPLTATAPDVDIPIKRPYPAGPHRPTEPPP